jgi:predicted transcriptional regulator
LTENSTLVSVRLPDNLRREVDEFARRTKRSRSFIVKEAVTAYMEEQNAYSQAIDEAIREADKGVFVSGEAASEWLRSWGTTNEKPVPGADIFPPSKS